MKPFANRHIFRLSETSSTNTVAMEMSADSPPNGSVILTYHQTQGKGQKGNQWESKAGLNLTFSIICFPDFLPLSRLYELSKIACLAVRACVEQWLPNQEVLIKWPNDVLLNRKKVAGILIENQLEGTHIQTSVVGIGLNVNQHVFSREIEKTATSLSLVAKREFNLEQILNSFLVIFDQEYQKLSRLQYDSIGRQYLQHLYGYQEAIAIQVGTNRLITPIIGIDTSGRMALMREGKLQYFDVKEASILIE